MKLFKKIFLLTFLPVFSYAQNSFINMDTVAGKLLLRTRSASTEQIVLQTNKKIYSPEENIWFKAFEIDSLTGRLRNTSKILFADLVDAKDKVIRHLTLDIANAQQTGAFLPDSTLSGFYWIRAYTENILHHNMNNMAVQAVYIVNANGRQNNHFNAGEKNAGTATNKNVVLTLYPEGGRLISGASSLVVVKLIDGEGQPLSDSILIKDNHDIIAGRFLTNKNGLAKFVFEPSSYRTYGVFVLRDNHYDSITKLPRTNPYAMQVAVTEQTQQSIKLRILLEDSVYKKDYKTFLIALHKDSIFLGAEARGNCELNLPASKFAPGITHFLLYNADGKLVSERDIYIKKDNIEVTMQTANDVYGAREKIDMNFSIKDESKPVLSLLSVSVNDARVNDSLDNFSVDTLVNMPAGDVDFIMLTQSKSTFFYAQYSDSVKDNLVEGNRDNLNISGALYTKKNQAAANKPILIISNDHGGYIMQDTTNAVGKFSFELAGFNTGASFSMQVNGDNSTKDDYRFELDSAANFSFKTPAVLKEIFSAEQLQNLKKTESFYMNSALSGQGWLPDITVKTSNLSKNTNAFPETIIPKEVLHSGTVSNVADAVLRYSKLRIIGGYLMWGGPNRFAPGPTDEPEIVMDGVRLEFANTSGSVLGFLKTVSTSGVDHIRILTGPSAAIYGLLRGTGVIEIYSATNSTYSTITSSGLTTIYPKGFDAAPAFVVPDYTDKHAKNSKAYDSRTALYWNGDIMTDENGNASISFFTGDTPAAYIVTVSGITENGDKIYKTFTVKTR